MQEKNLSAYILKEVIKILSKKLLYTYSMTKMFYQTKGTE